MLEVVDVDEDVNGGSAIVDSAVPVDVPLSTLVEVVFEVDSDTK